MNENPFEALPRVFVVDDEPAVAKLLAVVLQMNLFDAIIYTDPIEALRDARARAPDYLLTDLSMPGMDGIELATRLRNEVSSCKILLFTGQDNADFRMAKSAELGNHFELIRKPIHPTRLIEAIRKL